MQQSKTSGASGGSGRTSLNVVATEPGPFGASKKGPALSLADMQPGELVSALDAVLDTGALLSIGRTSDGGAIGVYLTNDGNRFKEWASTPDDLERIFDALREWGVSRR